jgi:hypothetical protein
MPKEVSMQTPSPRSNPRSIPTAIFRAGALVYLILVLAACSASGENQATRAAQAERSIQMATRMASGIQATLEVEHAHTTATAQVIQSLQETARQWPLVLYDPFDSDLGLWETGNSIDDFGKSWWDITNGRYEWRVEATQGLVWWSSPDMEPVGDFYLSVMAQKLDGASASLYGVAFRIFDIKHYYVLQVNENRQYSVYVYNYEDGWSELIPWGETEALYSDQPNHLEVIGQDTNFLFFFNDQYINQVSNDLFTSGTAGLLTGLDNAGEQARWAFDDFELRTPTLAPVSETPTP